jgi:spermidine synthase
MKPWKVLDAEDTDDGRLELRCRGDKDYVITINGRVLMSSMLHRSEVELATRSCEALQSRKRPRVLTAGLGLGFTLRAALDVLPRSAKVVVTELNPVVVRWCRGHAATLSGHALADKRVTTVLGDVMECVRDAGDGRRPPYDAIVIDLYLGPGADEDGDPLYGAAALIAVKRALTPGGVYAVWGEEHQPAFEQALRRAGFVASHARTRGPGRRHVIYLATKPA